MYQAIILAGGLGSRLQSVVKDVPKPMADINGKPFLAHLLTHLKKYQISDIVISTGYLQEKILQYFGNSYLGINIKYAKEEVPLGTGGAIVNSLKQVDQNRPVIILNGDTFLEVDYKKLLDFHHKNNSDLTMVLRYMEDCSRYGNIVVNDNNFITAFIEKSLIKKSGLINGGIYIINPKLFSEYVLQKNFSFEKDFLEKNLSQLKPQGFVADGYFIDIGIPEDYKKAQNELPKIIKNKALFLDRDGVINVDSGHVYKIKDFQFIEGIFEFCKKAADMGYLIFVITNQAGIAKGYYTEEEFLELTKWMENEFLKRGIRISKTYYCPYHVDAKIEKYKQDSFDRKPNPGMILKAIEEFNIDPALSIMIGDKASDIEAARLAGVAGKVLFDGNDNKKMNYPL